MDPTDPTNSLAEYEAELAAAIEHLPDVEEPVEDPPTHEEERE